MRAIAETGFDAIYLIAVINIGILMIRSMWGEPTIPFVWQLWR